MSRVLVVKLGALGDFVLAFGPFAAIRARHAGAEITLLTTAPYAELASASPWFDRVVVDRRPRPWNLPGLLRLRQAVRGFDMVYDLQTSDRSSWYFWLAGRPAWSGIAPGCAFPHANPARDAMHTVERQRDQLAKAGMTLFPAPELDWLKPQTQTASWPDLIRPSTPLASHPHNQPGTFVASGSFSGEGRCNTDRVDGRVKSGHDESSSGSVILIPGAAPHRRRKRWPAERFGELAATLAEQGLAPTVVGAASDASYGAVIRQICPTAIDLTGRTTLLQLAQTLSGATLAIGNDTGPTHLAAALGVPTIALFSADSDPALTRPRGDVTVLAETDLTDLTVARVAAALPQVHSHQNTPMEAL